MKFSLICILFTTLFFSCQTATDDKTPSGVQQISEEIRQIYVPDRRVGVFDIEYTASRNQLIAKGQSTSAEAITELFQKLSGAGYQVVDSIRLLPDTIMLGNKIYGVVNLSVCNLHSKGDFASEMVTQGLLGMPIRILDHDNWYRIQTPDNYIAWVHRAGIQPMTSEEYRQWNAAEKVIVTEHYGFVYQKADLKTQTVSDVVAGNRFRYLGEQGSFYKIMYPDGRQGFVPKNISMKETEWRKSLKQDATSILQTAYTLMGVPYLWAGTSSKGMDCSGYVRNVLYMHDIIIPRDASQQAYVGKRIDIEPDFSNLLPGDLIFFGRKATNESKERVVHVGMYIGNKRFIHSQGDVRIGSFDENDAAFDEFNLNRMLHATRFLDSIGADGISTTAMNTYY